jgi:hypothetical protein
MGKLFVMVFAPPRRDFVTASWRILNFCFCTQDRFVMVVAPGHEFSLKQSTGLFLYPQPYCRAGRRKVLNTNAS